MSTAAVHIAKKLARIEGVDSSFVRQDGGVDVVLRHADDHQLREHVLQVAMRAMVPARCFVRDEDGNVVSFLRNEAIEDFYTNIHVAGFAGSAPSAPADQIAGDAQGDRDVGKSDERDKDGQLKLTRIRSSSRGRPVVGWRYGDTTLKVDDKVKFKQPCVLAWTMGRTVKVPAGMTGKVSQVSSRSPMAYLSMGGHTGIELPVHALGHVFDVMVDPKLESAQGRATTLRAAQAGLPPEIARLVMAVGFGRPLDDLPTNSPKFRGKSLPDLSKSAGRLEAVEDAEEDMLVPDEKKDKAPSQGKGDDRHGHVSTREPRVTVRQDGQVSQKRVLLARR